MQKRVDKAVCRWPSCKRRIFERNGVWRHADTGSKYCNTSDYDKNVAEPKGTPLTQARAQAQKGGK